jgi:hypothetical protein
MATKLYADRMSDVIDLDDLGALYFSHVMAMTAEGLHEKSAIAAELAWRDHRIADLESLLAERNRQNAAAFADRDALLADQRRLLYLASTASMNWGHRERAGYTLDPLQFESARDVIRPDDFRRAIDAAMAGPCADIRAAKVHP